MYKKTGKNPSLELSPAKEPDRSPKTLNGHFLYNPIVHVSLIILFGLIAYSNTFNSPFALDDIDNIIKNNRVKDISNMPSFFTHIEGQPIMARPLTAVTFAINYYFGKLDTTGYHIFNLALHIANGVLLFFLIKITAGYLNYDDEKKTGLIALFSSLIFIAHPIQTESVTYIVSRSVLLSTFFFLLGIILFTKTAGAEGKRKLIYTTFLFIVSLLGMASRDEFFLFPVMLILYDLYFISKQDIKGVLRNYKIHLPVITTLGYVLYIVLTFNYGAHAGFGVKTVTPIEYLMTQFNVHWTYLRLLIFPINQNLDYDYPIAKTLFELPTILSSIGYIGLWVTGIYLYKKRPVISFCILWFMIALAPSSSIMPIKDVIFEHRLYMPSVGAIIAFSTAIFYALQFSVRRLHIFSYHFSLPTSYFLLLSAVVIVFSIVTYQRNTVWQDEVNLWEDVVRKSPEKVRVYCILGEIYSDKGWTDKAIENYQIALRFEPDFIEVHNNLGNVYRDKGWVDKAIEHYQIAIWLGPDYTFAHNNVGNAYADKGWIDKAIEHYRFALRLKPDFIEAHNNLGGAYEKKGLPEEAIKEYQIALMINPEFKAARDNLNRLLRKKGK